MRMSDRGTGTLDMLRSPERAAPSTPKPPAPSADAEAMRAAVDRLRTDRASRVERLGQALSRPAASLEPGKGRLALGADGALTFDFGPQKEASNAA